MSYCCLTNAADFDKEHARPDNIKQHQDEYVPVCGSGQVPGGQQLLLVRADNLGLDPGASAFFAGESVLYVEA
jgi:hypothetical protein